LLATPSSRTFCSTPRALEQAPSKTNPRTLSIYNGPLAITLRRLKVFTLSSLSLSFGFTPFLFVVESTLPMTARAALAGAAMVTTSISTALVAWGTRPYVIRIQPLPASAEEAQQAEPTDGIELTTLTLGLKERVTRVYDTAFLVDSRRPLAKWELAKSVVVPDAGAAPGTEETVAETRTEDGVVGRWIVRWGADGSGTCREDGKVVRCARAYFTQPTHPR
jgi:hypothetical protein